VEQIKPIPIVDEMRTGESAFPNGCEHDIGPKGIFKDTVKWRITSRDLESGQEICEEYDAVLVCNGYVVWSYVQSCVCYSIVSCVC